MKKRFLVLIDFSSYSKELLQTSYRWSQNVDAELMLVHVPIIPLPALTDAETEMEIKTHETIKALNKLKSFARETLGNANNLNFKVSTSNLLNLITELLKKGYNDIIFAGLKGTGTLKKIFIGSTTIDIINYINHHIIAIPKKNYSNIPDTFYVAININYPLNLPHLEYLLNFFEKQIKKIEFISIIKNEDGKELTIKYLKSLVSKYSSTFGSSYTIFENENALRELQHHIKRQANGLLVIQRGTRSFLDYAFRRFFINDLVYDAKIPIVVIPE